MKYSFFSEGNFPQRYFLNCEKELKKASGPHRLHHDQITGGLNSCYEGRVQSNLHTIGYALVSRYWRLLKIRDFVQKYITEICERYITLNYFSFNEMSKKDLTCDVFHCVFVYACCF